MKLYVKQNFFGLKDRFYIYDDDEKERYYVEGDLFSLAKRLHIYDMTKKCIATIDQTRFSFAPAYRITTSENRSFEIIKRFSLWKHQYEVHPFRWTVYGDFFAHDYVVTDGDTTYGRTLIRVYKDWFTFGDAYKIEFGDGIDDASAVSVMLVVDACMEQGKNISVRFG